MYAMIRLGNGNYYTSYVYGYYFKTRAREYTYEPSVERYAEYYVVLDQEKRRLIKQFRFPKGDFELFVLLTDVDYSNWILSADGQGCVSCLAGIDPDTIEEGIPERLLEECIRLDAEYEYDAYPEVKTQRDIDNLMEVVGGFHDAYIVDCHLTEDNFLYVRFDGIWGCLLEVWFSGDVAYSVKSRDDEDPCWYGATVLAENGFIYLIYDTDMKVEEINDGYCWFKARSMKYHVIPN